MPSLLGPRWFSVGTFPCCSGSGVVDVEVSLPLSKSSEHPSNVPSSDIIEDRLNVDSCSFLAPSCCFMMPETY